MSKGKRTLRYTRGQQRAREQVERAQVKAHKRQIARARKRIELAIRKAESKSGFSLGALDLMRRDHEEALRLDATGSVVEVRAVEGRSADLMRSVERRLNTETKRLDIVSMLNAATDALRSLDEPAKKEADTLLSRALAMRADIKKAASPEVLDMNHQTAVSIDADAQGLVLRLKTYQQNRAWLAEISKRVGSRGEIILSDFERNCLNDFRASMDILETSVSSLESAYIDQQGERSAHEVATEFEVGRARNAAFQELQQARQQLAERVSTAHKTSDVFLKASSALRAAGIDLIDGSERALESLTKACELVANLDVELEREKREQRSFEANFTDVCEGVEAILDQLETNDTAAYKRRLAAIEARPSQENLERARHLHAEIEAVQQKAFEMDREAVVAELTKVSDEHGVTWLEGPEGLLNADGPRALLGTTASGDEIAWFAKFEGQEFILLRDTDSEGSECEFLVSVAKQLKKTPNGQAIIQGSSGNLIEFDASQETDAEQVRGLAEDEQRGYSSSTQADD